MNIYKTIFRLTAFLITAGILTAAGISPDEKLGIPGNWRLTRNYINTSGNYTEDIIFYDGLGYPDQIIRVGASPGSRNLVTPLWYDNMMRNDSRIYLPYESTGCTPAKEVDPYGSQAAFYQNYAGSTERNFAFYRNTYAPSPLNRITESYNTGSAYASRKTGHSYGTNGPEEVLRFREEAGGDLTITGYYEPGELYKHTSTSEDGCTCYTYTDKSGHKILEKNLIENQTSAGTYYIYNAKGDPVWVISPEGTALLPASGTLSRSDAIASRYCYIYVYDGRGNIIEQQLPGRGTLYYIYDKGGRTVLSQDAVQRTSGNWTYYVYDNMNRETERTLVACNASRSVIQANYYNSTFHNNYPVAGSSSGQKVPPAAAGNFTLRTFLKEIRYAGYPYSGAPFVVPGHLSFKEVSGVVYLGDTSPNSLPGAKIYEKTALLTGSSGTETPGYVERAFYYDNRHRPVQIVERNYLGGISRTSFQYDFTGNILKCHESHQSVPGGTAVTKQSVFTYDNRHRLLSETAFLNGTAAGSVTYGYDNTGRLVSKTYGNGVTEMITYNIQGWQTAQNVTRNGTALYSSELRYYNPVKSTGALYGGNISEWSSKQSEHPQSTYGFTYDLLNRITHAARYQGASATPQASYTEQGITYDKNGNITTLKRYASAPADDFTYHYTGNLLMSLSGSINASYTYDANGNMTGDGRKNLQITYNLLNLPEVISRGSVTQARYIYTADSIKCETTGNANSGYAYLGSLIFNKNAAGYAFESAEFGGGRIINTTGTIAPAYYTTDHLGSVRMITDANGTIQEQNDYYPFGGRHTTGNTYAALPGNNYKFNGKEEQTTGATGYLDYGARMYDNVTGRWGTPDPLAEKYYSLTPYDFCGSNPVSRIDPNGMNWYQNSRGNVMWRNSASDSFMDDNRAVWTNIGETYTHYRSDGSSVFFYQKTNQDGDMTLASHTFSPNETAAFGLFHSNEAREAAMQNHVNPTWGSFLSMVAKEMKAQWTDPYLLTAGATAFMQGIPSGSSGNYGARSSANARRLNLQLASEEQMMFKGRNIISTEKLRNASRLAKQYGGDPGDWVKRASDSYKGHGIQFETHWYENQTTGLRVEFKTKIK